MTIRMEVTICTCADNILSRRYVKIMNVQKFDRFNKNLRKTKSDYYSVIGASFVK